MLQSKSNHQTQVKISWLKIVPAGNSSEIDRGKGLAQALTVGTEEAPLPIRVHTDMPDLTLGLGVCEQPLPGPAVEGGVRGGGEDGIVQAGLPRDGLSQPVQGVSGVRVASSLGLGLGPTAALWSRSGGGVESRKLRL